MHFAPYCQCLCNAASDFTLSYRTFRLFSAHKQCTELWLLPCPGRDKDLQTKQHWVCSFFSFPILGMWNAAKCPLNQEDVVLWWFDICLRNTYVCVTTTPGRAGWPAHMHSQWVFRQLHSQGHCATLRPNTPFVHTQITENTRNWRWNEYGFY